MAKQHITLTVNGKQHEALVEPRMLLIHFLREQLALTGAHIGCETSHCGACTVDLDGRSVKSCTLFAVQANGAEIRTVEGMASADGLHPIQAAFIEAHGLQCGFCTPGMIMRSYRLLQENPNPSEAEILSGIPEAKIHVIAPDIGGGFGNKVGVYPGYVCAIVASIVLGVPVKWVEDRIENLTATAFARDYHMTGELAATRDGRITVTPSPHHPIGAEGVGESPNVGGVSAFSNTVVDAFAHLGVRHLPMPHNAARLWQVCDGHGLTRPPLAAE